MISMMILTTTLRTRKKNKGIFDAGAEKIPSRIEYCILERIAPASTGAIFDGGIMKKGEVYEGIIEKVDFPNRGCVFIDGQRVIVKNGIPGQKVRFVINKTFRMRRRQTAGGPGKVPVRDAGACMQLFSGMRRMYVSDHAL